MLYYPALYRRGTARRSLAAVLRADCCAVTVCSRGDPRMDVETFTHEQQLQQPGRGDRVARTREAIIASALALALAHAPESWVVLRHRLGLTVEQARDELRFVTRAIVDDDATRR